MAQMHSPFQNKGRIKKGTPKKQAQGRPISSPGGRISEGMLQIEEPTARPQPREAPDASKSFSRVAHVHTGGGVR